MDSTGRINVPLIYDSIKMDYNHIRTFKSDNKEGLYTYAGKKIADAEYSQIFALFDDYTPYCAAENGKQTYLIFDNGEKKLKNFLIYTQGLYELEKEVVVQVVFSENVTDAMVKDRYHYSGETIWGILSGKGENVVPMKYSRMFLPFEKRSPYFIANYKNYSSLLYSNGKEVKKDYLITGFMRFAENEKFIVKAIKSEDIKFDIWNVKIRDNTASESVLRKQISINNEEPMDLWYSLYDENGEVLDLSYNFMEFMDEQDEHIIRTVKNGKWGLYDTKSEVWILPLKYYEISQTLSSEIPLIKVKKTAEGNYSYYDL